MSKVRLHGSSKRAPLGRAFGAVWQGARRKPLAALGFIFVAAALLTAAVAPLIAPYDGDAQNLTAVREPPSVDHLFGTDQLGRDVFSRVIYGTRTSLLIGVSSIAIAASLGTAIGLCSAYALGLVDLLVQRAVDALSSLPTLVLLLSVVVILGNEPWQIVIGEAIVFVPTSVRLVRAEALVQRAQPYVESARAQGAGTLRILLRHVLPGTIPILIVIASVQLGAAILLESSLSYLGYGIQPPTPNWGYMLSGTTQAIAIQLPWVAIAPGAAIAITVFGFNVLGDGLRDLLDPKLRGR